jgi:hypothetical protein
MAGHPVWHGGTPRGGTSEIVKAYSSRWNVRDRQGGNFELQIFRRENLNFKTALIDQFVSVSIRVVELTSTCRSWRGRTLDCQLLDIITCKSTPVPKMPLGFQMPPFQLSNWRQLLAFCFKATNRPCSLQFIILLSLPKFPFVSKPCSFSFYTFM